MIEKYCFQTINKLLTFLKQFKNESSSSVSLIFGANRMTRFKSIIFVLKREGNGFHVRGSSRGRTGNFVE